jgi:phosphinothricin acetyltransferase
MKIKFEKIGMQHQKSIMKIFNYYIENSTAAFPAITLPEQFFTMLLERAKWYPAYAVLNQETLQVVGFCLLSAYNPLSTFKETASISYFIEQSNVGKGIGEQCLKKLEIEAMQMGIKHIIAEISSENQQSLRFHSMHGFEMCGTLKNIGYKFKRNFDVIYMQKDLCNNPVFHRT